MHENRELDRGNNIAWKKGVEETERSGRRHRPRDKWGTRRAHGVHLTRSGQPGLSSVSPFFPISSHTDRNVRIDVRPCIPRAGDPMGNRKWARGVRDRLVRLAYAKFTSGLPRNYHCRNSRRRKRVRSGYEGGYRDEVGRSGRKQSEGKEKYSS